MKFKKECIVICTLFVIAVSYAVYTSNTPNTTFYIELGENGFSPATTTIARGDTVQFVTSTGKEFWPASNNHPAHTVYAAFDSDRPVQPHESWQFTFTQSGAWGYHDHLHSFYTGVIIVE